ncbi:hypothetical protein M409DRAFT_70606 [Zasmidium cellare ATCC 36951]|uniref:Pre-rRNA-processing protein IPI3 n=1 Tax=Zasmidium cellare ATCC 36951 TaxID=1080233 RepID=A0A6A6C1V9_ZASCE|nr:uncharacterized protein M409DRAFT_70606 [Zasmidium cellare ATCC 36951]KAF2160268.1 hypothetical protein M409DRAFT_70606 [Zasmidium cellare ATCC 36951]
MLTEHFIASVGTPTKPPGTNIAKDAAIFLHEFQPLSQQRSILKKSATAPNCLAVSETHIFAAQENKGVVHVYNREKGNQEAIVPFTERISSITLACNDSVLILGTVEGRIFLWETYSGRQVTTTQAHLQAVTSVKVDATSNFLLSASKDSTVHVWSVPALLSFSTAGDVSPLRTFSSHRGEITSLVLGHSASHCNFAVSVSKDRTCLIWDYRTNHLLRTYLLPGVPLCLCLDPADRSVYVGYEDGSIQQIDLYASPIGSLDAVQNGKNPTDPVQPPTSSIWKVADSSHGATLSLDVSFDGNVVISGHQSGAILSWDVARGNFISSQTQHTLPAPVNCLSFLPVTGFATSASTSPQKNTKIHEAVKPKFAAFDTADSGTVPGNYTVQVRFPKDLHLSRSHKKPSDFMTALTAPSFPTALLDEGLCELASWGKTASNQSNGHLELDALRRVQKTSFDKMGKLNEDRKALLKREQARLARKGSRKPNGKIAPQSDEDLTDEDSG